MKISYSWLKEYINVDLPAEEVSDILTDTGLEVEGLERIESIKGGLRGVVIGEVLTCVQHPNADRLKLTTVNIGAAEPVQIVCGAPNVAAGQKVLVATIGTTIYTEDGSFEIKKAKLRGETSEGMICAEDELGLGHSHDGIMVLAPDSTVGTPAAKHFKIESDEVFEIGLTPNRTDAMSHYGVARDLRAALLRRGHEGVETHLPSITSFSVTARDLPVQIKVLDTAACPRYMGVSLKNVKVADSPSWLQNRLKAIGLSPINNIVDITNYVLHETGHPLHAFDYDQISGAEIQVKKLSAGTKFITLDDKERSLDAEDLMICDTEKGLVLAGVFGGKDSGVSKGTTKVFLEAAYFEPVGIRKSAKRHGLNTDSSFRYERGVDPELTSYALQRAAVMIRDIAGGEIAMEIRDVQDRRVEGAEVRLNLSRMNKLIGKDLPASVVRSILHSLDIQIKAESTEELLLQVPAYRADVTREADIVEEVLRIYGFNNVEIPSKMNISVAQTDPRSSEKLREKTSVLLSGRGFQEVMNNSLSRPEYLKEDWGFDPSKAVDMLNPLSRDLAIMRQTLLFGGLESIQRNINRQRPSLRFFEFGKSYRNDHQYKENNHLALWVTGAAAPDNWREEAEESDFYHIKEEVTQILQKLGLSNWRETDVDIPIYQQGIQLKVGKKKIGHLGILHADILAATDLKQGVYYADLNWEVLAELARSGKSKFKELPRFPEVRRDLALLLNKEVKYLDLEAAARNTDSQLLKRINLFDVYEGKNLPADKKSYALSFILQNEEKTLNDKEVDQVMDKLLHTFKTKFEAELR